MPGRPRLTRAQVLMYLAVARGRRSEAARIAGVSRMTFYRAMQRYGIRVPRAPRRLDIIDDVPLIQQLVEDEGLPLRAVAAKFDVHHATVLRRVRPSVSRETEGG